MTLSDNPFFSENLTSINKFVSKLLVAINLVPIIFVIFTFLGIFRIDYSFSCICLLLTTLFSAVNLLLVYILKKERLAVYFGLLGLHAIISYMGSHAHIGIYISYAFSSIIATFYHDRKILAKVISINFVIMIVSLYFKSIALAAEPAVVERGPTLGWFLPHAFGFAVEFFFLVLVIRFLMVRTERTLRHLVASIDDRSEFLQKLNENSKELVNINRNFEKTNAELKEIQFKIMKFVADCLGSHDVYTGCHVNHTVAYVKLIAEKLRENGHYVDELTDETISLYSSAAFLHDIGKIHIPEGILNKNGKFTDREFELMKGHPAMGKKLLESLPLIEGGKFNDIAIKMAYYHHEKWDGTGYPERISGEQIPLCARIMAGADVLDALISKRLYKEPMSIDQAVDVFEKSKGTHFEPCISEAVIAIKDEVKKIDDGFKLIETEQLKEELEWWLKYHEEYKAAEIEKLEAEIEKLKEEINYWQQKYKDKKEALKVARGELEEVGLAD